MNPFLPASGCSNSQMPRNAGLIGGTPSAGAVVVDQGRPLATQVISVTCSECKRDSQIIPAAVAAAAERGTSPVVPTRTPAEHLPAPCQHCCCYLYNDRITLGGSLVKHLGLYQKALEPLGTHDTPAGGLNYGPNAIPPRGIGREKGIYSPLVFPTPGSVTSMLTAATRGPHVAPGGYTPHGYPHARLPPIQSLTTAPAENVSARSLAKEVPSTGAPSSSTSSRLLHTRQHKSFNATDFLYRTEPVSASLISSHRRRPQANSGRPVRRREGFLRQKYRPGRQQRIVLGNGDSGSASGEGFVMMETVSYRSSSSYISSIVEDDENGVDSGRENSRGDPHSSASSNATSSSSGRKDQRDATRKRALVHDEGDATSQAAAAEVTVVATVGSWLHSAGSNKGRRKVQIQIRDPSRSPRSQVAVVPTSSPLRHWPKPKASPVPTREGKRAVANTRTSGHKHKSSKRNPHSHGDAVAKISRTGGQLAEDGGRSKTSFTYSDRPDPAAIKLATSRQPLPGISLFPNPEIIAKSREEDLDEFTLAKKEAEERQRRLAEAETSAVRSQQSEGAVSTAGAVPAEGHCGADSSGIPPLDDCLCLCYCHLPTTRLQMESFLHQGFTSTVLACTRLSPIHRDVIDQCFGHAFRMLGSSPAVSMGDNENREGRSQTASDTEPLTPGVSGVAEQLASPLGSKPDSLSVRYRSPAWDDSSASRHLDPAGFEADIDSSAQQHHPRHHSTLLPGRKRPAVSGIIMNTIPLIADEFIPVEENAEHLTASTFLSRGAMASASSASEMGDGVSTGPLKRDRPKQTDEDTPAKREGQPSSSTSSPLTENSSQTISLAKAQCVKSLFDWLAPIEVASELVIKLIHKDKCTTDELEQCLLESRFLTELEHPNVAHLLGHYDGDHELWLFFERANYDDLEFSILNKPVDEHQARYIMTQILQGLEYVHSRRIIHGDIKPKNILVYDKYRRSSSSAFLKENKQLRHPKFTRKFENAVELKLADFGLALKLPPDRDTIRFGGVRGSQGFFAPEILLRRDYGTKVDLWAAGIIHFQLLAGYEPFYPSSSCISESVRFDDRAWDDVSEAAKDFCRCLLTFDPVLRLSASDALRHPWIRNGPSTNNEAARPVIGEH